MTPIERQVRILMHAWPIPDRAERGEEVVGTTLDLVPDGANRVPLALAINLVMGGFRARMLIRPPLWRWAYYRAGGRLPARWHRWMLNDLSGPGWRRRILVSRLTMAVVAIGTARVLVDIKLGTRSDPMSLLITLAAYCAGMLTFYRSMTRRDRDRQLNRNGYGTSHGIVPSPPPSGPGPKVRRTPLSR
jgi:Family of unknown function (DUF5313)